MLTVDLSFPLSAPDPRRRGYVQPVRPVIRRLSRPSHPRRLAR